MLGLTGARRLPRQSEKLLAAAGAADPEFATSFLPSIDYKVLNQCSDSADYDIPPMPLAKLEHYRKSKTS